MMGFVKHKSTIFKVKICKSFFSKLLGLMFNDLNDIDGAFFILGWESSSIHMYFVKKDLDIIWLDENLKVIDIKLNLKPNSGIYSPKAKAKYILELKSPLGRNIKIGDKIDYLIL